MHMRIGVYCRKIVGKNEFTPVNSNTFRKIYSATPQEYMTFRVVKVCIVTEILEANFISFWTLLILLDGSSSKKQK